MDIREEQGQTLFYVEELSDLWMYPYLKTGRHHHEESRRNPAVHRNRPGRVVEIGWPATAPTGTKLTAEFIGRADFRRKQRREGNRFPNSARLSAALRPPEA